MGKCTQEAAVGNTLDLLLLPVAMQSYWQPSMTSIAGFAFAIHIHALMCSPLTCLTAANARAACFGKYTAVYGIDYRCGQPHFSDDLGDVIAMAIGQEHSCAILPNRSVVCGSCGNFYGQVDVPSDLGPVASLTAGNYHTCAITLDGGRVVCWGQSDSLQTQVPPGLGKVLALSAGATHTCALLADNIAKCWGDDTYRQLQIPPNLGRLASVHAGESRTCVVTLNASRLVCWGQMLAYIEPPDDLGPVLQVTRPQPRFQCALLPNATVRCWSAYNSTASYKAITAGLAGVAGSVSSLYGCPDDSAGYANGQHVCVFTTSRKLRCFGLRDGPATLPEEFAGPGAVMSVALGPAHACYLVPLREWLCLNKTQIDPPWICRSSG